VDLTPEHKLQLELVAVRLVRLNSGTPITTLRRQLGPKRRLLDDLKTMELLRVIEDQYVPTFRGTEQLDDGTRLPVRGILNAVLSVLKSLYDRAAGDSITLPFNVLVDATAEQYPALQANAALPALLLGEQFGYYFLNNVKVVGDRLSVQAVFVVEQIMDFISVEDAWPKVLAQEEARQEAAARMADPILSPPSPDPPDVQFMRNAKLHKIVERDYAELQGVRSTGGVKSRYVLCGGLIEALLLDALLGEEPRAKAAKKSPKVKGGGKVEPLLDWNLGELIDVALELRVIETDVEKFSHAVRNYRNLIHPGKEIQSQQKVAEEEAAIAEKVLEIVIRELPPCQ
jgi:hypothetical protein